ncbi:MAG: DUF3990 domain-containing protein [Tannerellaceae bacterium]|jgi:hypothetical protein|nr:DUF3990 domain-containing protein [Tannerellaceae bacterium]
MQVYHGGYCPIEYPEIRTGRYAKDFGTGFYCTELKAQTVRWSMRYTTPTVSIYEFEPDNSLNILHFTETTEEWLDFIVDCRNGISHNYDIVIGAMANDQIYNYISDYVNGVITREQFWVLAKYKPPTRQINFCTPAALKCLTYKESEEIKNERQREERT